MRRGWLRSLLLPLLVAACGSASVADEQAPAARPEEPTPTPGGEARDASADTSGERAPSPTTPGAWTMESPQNEVLKNVGISVRGIVADPATPRRLMFTLYAGGPPGGGAQLAAPWHDGVFGSVLVWAPGTDAIFSASGNGGGFAANGDFYDFIAGHDGRVATEIGVLSGPKWSWRQVAATSEGSWPPSRVHVMPGLPVRVFLQAGRDLLEITTPNVVQTRLGDVSSIVFDDDRTTYVGRGPSGFVRCTLATHSCAPIAAAGIGAGESVEAFERDLHHARWIVRTSEGQGQHRHFYTSTDGAASFHEVPVTAIVYPSLLTVPGQPSTFVTRTMPTSGTSERIVVTRDAGKTWTDIPPPSTSITDVSGLAVDAGGTLFLVRAHALWGWKL